MLESSPQKENTREEKGWLGGALIIYPISL